MAVFRHVCPCARHMCACSMWAWCTCVVCMLCTGAHAQGYVHGVHVWHAHSCCVVSVQWHPVLCFVFSAWWCQMHFGYLMLTQWCKRAKIITEK